MKRTLLWLISLSIFTISGCSVTSHPDYQQTFFKKNVDDSRIQQILSEFHKNGLMTAAVERDNLGRLQLSGSYENENDVAKAFGIVEKVVGSDSLSRVRPSKIKVLNWELEATKEFAKFIQGLVKKYKLDASVETDGVNKQINIANIGFDGAEQFSFDSDTPSETARNFYIEFAKKLADVGGASINAKKLLIVGHTDDVGDSKYNATLSERRARSVGKIFSEQGFDPKNIFYQGAGEAYPVASNETGEGRSKNRRVEFTELDSHDTMKSFVITRQPKPSLYRFNGSNSAESGKVSVKEVEPRAKEDRQVERSNKTHAEKLEKRNSSVAQPTSRNLAYSKLNFGGVAYTPVVATLNVGGYAPKKSSFNFISHANSDDAASMRDCSLDRPRYVGKLKSLQTGLPEGYVPTDFIRGLGGKSWYGTINNHLALLNDVYVLEGSGQSPVPANILIYGNYANDPAQKPNIAEVAPVNSYALSGGVLYRMFPPASSGLVCMDILFPVDRSGRSKGAVLLYNSSSGIRVAHFEAKLSQ